MKSLKTDPPTKTTKHDGKAEQLTRLDREAMEAFRQGKQSDGFVKLLGAAKTYQKLTPADCTSEEALAVAVIYARIASIAGKSLPEETTLAYTFGAKEYAKKGGVASGEMLRWFEGVLKETVAAYKQSGSPGVPAQWVADARKELDSAKRKPKIVEPVKPAGMTPAEYDVLKVSAVSFFNSTFPVDAPEKMPDGAGAAVMLDIKFEYDVLMPESRRVVRREAYTRLAGFVKEDKQALTNLANAFPVAIKLHDDPKFLASMKSRLPWAERKKLYDQFTKATGQTEKWSLLHPFDDLTGEEMRSVVAAAEKAKSSGLGAVTASERALILRAGALDFFASLIP